MPHRGDKRALLGTVLKNAEDAMRLHKAKRVGDLTQRSAALEELAQVLELETAPLRIECYDVSHTQGTHQVASMVVFEDGAPARANTANSLFAVKTATAQVMTLPPCVKC